MTRNREGDPTEDEIKAIKKAQEEYKNDETVSYTINELRKEFLDEESSKANKRTFEDALKYLFDNYNETLKGLKDK